MLHPAAGARGPTGSHSPLSVASCRRGLLHLGDQVLEHHLGVAEEHHGVLVLKLLYLLESLTEVSVSDLSELLGVSVSAVSQHLSKLRARGLVNSRRDAQTIYYRLAEHDFIGRLREEYFGAWAN